MASPRTKHRRTPAVDDILVTNISFMAEVSLGNHCILWSATMALPENSIPLSPVKLPISMVFPIKNKKHLDNLVIGSFFKHKWFYKHTGLESGWSI